MRNTGEKIFSAADSAALELELQRFERAWQNDSPPEIADFLGMPDKSVNAISIKDQ